MERIKSFEELGSYYFNEVATDLSVYRQPMLSDFSKEIPLTIPERGSLKVLRISCHGPAEEVLKALLWEALFGRYYLTFHWFLLFDFLYRQKTASNFTACLMTILGLSSAKGADVSFWKKGLKSVSATLKQFFPPEESRQKIQEILKYLPFKLPTADPIISELLSVSVVEKTLKTPKEPNRIAVGYKDKGSLGKPGGSYDPSEIDVGALHRKDVWTASLDRSKSIHPWSYNLPKKERKKQPRPKPICVTPASGSERLGSVARPETRIKQISEYEEAKSRWPGASFDDLVRLTREPIGIAHHA